MRVGVHEADLWNPVCMCGGGGAQLCQTEIVVNRDQR